MNQEYKDNNIKFLTVISHSKKSTQRAVYKSDKIKCKFDMSQQNKDRFYNSDEWKIMRRWVLDSYSNICFSCGSLSSLEVDHIQPISKFPHGALKYRNFQILCRTCNSLKSNKTNRRFKTAIHKRKPFVVTAEIKNLGKFNYWYKFFPPKSIDTK